MAPISIASVSQDRDPRSLFDLDDELIELMDRAEEAAEAGSIPEDLLQEINEYLEAFRAKVDRIAGYWRWQESIARTCGEEAEHLSARKRATEGRVARLKDMLLYFMMSRGLKKLEGDKASIGLQTNGLASLVIDDPRQIEERFFESSIRFTKAELREILSCLAEGYCGTSWRVPWPGQTGRSTPPPFDLPLPTTYPSQARG